ncbi:MAG: hypothetical protein JO360_06820 [Acidobacteria bacterium]|nr:hypothetical protein [Acidobacteriota bacterium]
MQKFCTHDGGRLVPDFEQPKPFDPNATVHADLSNLDIPATPPQPPPPPARPSDLSATLAGGPPSSPIAPPPAPPSAPTTGNFRAPDTGPTNFPETTRLGPPPTTQPPPPQNYPPQNYPPPPPAQSPQEFRTIAAPPPARPTGNIPTPPTGFPPSTTGAPASSGGFPTQSGGAPNQSGGFPNQSAGAPNQLRDFPTQSAGAPNQLGGAPNQSAGYPIDSAALPGGSASAPLPAAQKKSKLGLILALVGVLVLLILAGGGVGAYFYFKNKKTVESRNDSVTVNPTLDTNTNNNANNQTSGPETIKPKVEAPPNSVKFENSSANLDGKLAEHYLDFYFFYPQKWQKNPKAGVPGAANFVEVMRMLSPEQMQEDLTVSWYDSKGTVEADLAGKLPSLIKDANTNLAQNLAEYEKVSEGRTTINGIEGYEFRFKGVSYQGDSKIWGRIVYLPPGDVQSNKGVTLYMLTTSLAPELQSVDDVGVKGELPVILNSFTLGKS